MSAGLSDEDIYWTFSAAAQTIAAFAAFLLTGYALVHSLLESARERDDTLEEIHLVLRRRYHARLTALAWVTAAAILLSLGTVFVNRWEFVGKGWLIGITAAVDVGAIVGGLAFVVTIIEPSRYERAAERVLGETQVELGLGAPTAPAVEFFEAFRHLERLIREHLRRLDLYVSSRGGSRMAFSFRQMIEALQQNERIDGPFFKELHELSKYRNLVFHGHVDHADREMVERVRAAAARVASWPEGQGRADPSVDGARRTRP